MTEGAGGNDRGDRRSNDRGVGEAASFPGIRGSSPACRPVLRQILPLPLRERGGGQGASGHDREVCSGRKRTPTLKFSCRGPDPVSASWVGKRGRVLVGAKSPEQRPLTTALSHGEREYAGSLPALLSDSLGRLPACAGMTRFWPRETRPYICPFPHFTVMPRQPLTPTHTSPVLLTRHPARSGSPVLPARPPGPLRFPRPSRPATLPAPVPRPSCPATRPAPVPPSFPPGHPAHPSPPSFLPGYPARSGSPVILTLLCHSERSEESDFPSTPALSLKGRRSTFPHLPAISTPPRSFLTPPGHSCAPRSFPRKRESRDDAFSFPYPTSPRERGCPVE